MFKWLFGRNADPDLEPEPEQDTSHTLSDIIRGAAHAVATADEVQDKAFLKQLRYYFDLMEDGTLEPKYARVRVPGTDHHVDLPLITLMDPGTLALNEVEVDLAVRTTRAKLKNAVDQAEVDRTSFEVGFTGASPGSRNDVIQIKMKFKRPEHIREGPARLLEELNGTVKPRPNDGPGFDSTPPDGDNPLDSGKAPTEPLDPSADF